MKKITCRFRDLENWDAFEDYVWDSYDTGKMRLDADVIDPGVIVFYCWDSTLVRNWFTAPIHSVSIESLDEEELSSSEWTAIKERLEWTLEEPDRDVAGVAERLQHEQAQERSSAARDLAELGEAAASTIPSIIALLDDPERRVRVSAARALEEFGPTAKDAVPALFTFLSKQDRPQFELRDASTALRRLGADRTRLAQLLSPLLDHADPCVRKWVPVALSALGDAARFSLSDIARLLTTDSDPEVRRWAAEAMEEFGGLSEEQLGALESAASDDEIEKVRNVAGQALKRVRGGQR